MQKCLLVDRIYALQMDLCKNSFLILMALRKFKKLFPFSKKVNENGWLCRVKFFRFQSLIAPHYYRDCHPNKNIKSGKLCGKSTAGVIARNCSLISIKTINSAPPKRSLKVGQRFFFV